MSIEAGVLIGLDLEVLHWHLPNNRSGGTLPDSRDLWDVIWENRDRVMGFAHSHPGSGTPMPSYEDVTTFASVEAALGKRLVWWITSSDGFSEWCWVGPKKLDYAQGPALYQPEWISELRHRSEYYYDASVAALAQKILEAEDERVLAILEDLSHEV
jgi:hypothetical protein